MSSLSGGAHGLRARDGKKAGLPEQPQLIQSITNGLAIAIKTRAATK